MEFINLKTVMSNTRSRVVLIFTFGVLLIAVIVGVGLFSHNSAPGQASVNRVPKIQSTVGGFDQKVTPEYAKLLREQNKQQADVALRTDGSAVPTIINAQSFAENSPQNNVCNCSQNTCSSAGAAALQSTGPAPMGTICSDGTVRDASGKIIGKTGLVAPGGFVYDSTGKVIGSVGADGQVRDASGRVIGALSADGTVRDASGKVIGTTGSFGGAKVGSGSLVYDNAGHLIGSVGDDGKVRDANGQIIGELSADGQVRDASGKIIGKAVPVIKGSIVYDQNGKAIGSVDADGKVRDANGRVIGTVGPDGQVRDASGKVIGKAIPVAKGSIIYDQSGRVIGTVGADGQVRDANGNVIGAVGADGMVRDSAGKVIGSTSPTSLGTAVYDAQGKLLGTVGADGKVRDASGNVIGTVGADGVVRNAAGVPIGRTNYIAPGSAVFGADGRLLGSVGPDGRLIPANVGPSMNADGSTSGTLSPQDQALQRQQQVLQKQKASQMAVQVQNAMAGQLGQLVAVWNNVPVQTVMTGGNDNGTGPGGAGGASAAANAQILLKAGSIVFATLDTAVNTDEPGPVMATITGGPLKGGKLLGTLTNQGQKAMLSFNTLSMPNASSSVSISSVAIDPATARTALSSETDNHYLLRYGTLFASSFVSGYAQAVSQSGSQTTITLQGVTHSTPILSPQQKLTVALGNVGQQYSGVIGAIYNTPPTVKIYAGTGVGILLLADLPAPPGLATDENNKS